MKEEENILEMAIEAIKNEQIPPGPPQELVDATVTKLAEAQGQSDMLPFGKGMGLIDRLRAVRGITKFAAAAVLLICVGYAVGRVSAPRPPDMEELQTALEPAVRRNVVAQVRNDLQSALTNLRDDLDRQYSQDLSRVGMQILAASNTATSEQLTKLIEAIDEAQTHQRQWFAAAIGQVESNRRYETKQLSNAFASFAVQTEDKLERTKQGLAQLLSYGMPDGSAPYEFENSSNNDERTER